MTRFAIKYDPDHAGRIMHRLGLRERRKVVKITTDVNVTFANPAAEVPEKKQVVA